MNSNSERAPNVQLPTFAVLCEGEDQEEGGSWRRGPSRSRPRGTGKATRLRAVRAVFHFAVEVAGGHAISPCPGLLQDLTVEGTRHKPIFASTSCVSAASVSHMVCLHLFDAVVRLQCLPRLFALLTHERTCERLLFHTLLISPTASA